MYEHGYTRTNTKNDANNTVRESLCLSVYVANGALSLLNLYTSSR